VSDLAAGEEDVDQNKEVTEAENRLYWAERRRDEREALLEARQRARALKQEQESLQLQRAKSARRARSRNGKQKSAAGNRRWEDSELI
jgi:hypothetical protein